MVDGPRGLTPASDLSLGDAVEQQLSGGFAIQVIHEKSGMLYIIAFDYCV